jgi:hypothetical protein
VNLNSKKGDGEARVFVVPSSVLKERTVYTKHPKSELSSVYRDDNLNKGIKGVLACKDRWDVFGDPHAEVRLEEAPGGQGAEAEPENFQ